MAALLRRRTGLTAYILVMGSTGTGKSTFINLASGSDLRVGTGLHSQTATVELSRSFKHKSQRIIMVDTPGFDDTVKSDADVLTTIATYLERLYRKGIRIRGIIYLHRITDNRMGGTALRNLRMFEAICGEPAMASTVVVLNMWDQVQPGVAEARETELRKSDIFFKPTVNAGAQMKPHWGNQDSAAAILDYLVARRPVVLKIQHEMADEHKAIHTTSAGLVLLGDLAAKELKHAEELRRIREERAEARSRKDADEEGGLEDSEKSVEALRRKLAEEQQRLLEATNQASDNHGGFHRKLIMFLRRRLQLGH